MTPEFYPTEAVKPNGERLSGRIDAWEESPADRDSVMLRLSLPGYEIEKTADDFFSALTEIRKALEHSDLLLANYGSSLNVYPSPMSRNMGSGEKAYKLKFGEQARSSDLISIFDSGSDVLPSKVVDQEEFYEKWLLSLKK